MYQNLGVHLPLLQATSSLTPLFATLAKKHWARETLPSDFRFSIFVFRVRGRWRLPHFNCGLSATCATAVAEDYLPRNFSMVVSSASAMSRYFLAALVSCFCMAACALPRSVFMRCWAETMSPRRP